MQLGEKLARTLSVLRGYANPHGTRYEVVPAAHATKAEEILREFVLRDVSDARPLQRGLGHGKEGHVRGLENGDQLTHARCRGFIGDSAA